MAFRYSPVFLIAIGVLGGSALVLAHEPVPGPDYAGCVPQNIQTNLYAPVPFIDLRDGYEDVPVKNWPVGYYDFCAYMDIIYCSLQPLGSYASEINEFAGLIQCLHADLNGPLNPLEEVPMTGNGIPDGQCELGIVAAILNDTNHPLHTETIAKFQYNVSNTKELLIAALSNVPPFGSFPGGDIRPLVRIVAPYMPSALACILGAYAVLGDNQTFDMLDELLSMLEILGLTLPEDGIRGISQSVPELGQAGDANGDGFTNRQAFEYYVNYLEYTYPGYPPAAVNSDQPIQVLTLEGGGIFVEGTAVELTAVLNGDVVAPESANSFVWSQNGTPLPEYTEESLSLSDTVESDSGLYEVTVPVEWLLDPEDNTSILLSASTTVQINSPVPVVSRKIVFLILLCLLVSSGIAAIFRKKRNAL